MNIQLGVDIATSLSLIVTAIYFIYNLNKFNKEKREKHLIDLRVHQMTLVIKNLNKKMFEGYELNEYIEKSIAEDDVKDVPIKAYEYGKSLKIILLVHLRSELAIWGKQVEIDKINELISITENWCNSILKNPKPINFILDHLANTIQNIAKEIKYTNY